MIWNILKRKPNDGRNIARWLGDFYGNQEGDPPPPGKMFYVLFLMNALLYGIEDKEDVVGGEGVLETSNFHNADSSLFELVCFRFVQFDYYLFVNHESIRSQYSRWLQGRIVESFEDALGTGKVHQVFCDRAEGYGKILRENIEGDRDRSSHLAALLSLSKENQFVEVYNFDEHPFQNAGDVVSHFEEFARVTRWTVATMPIFGSLLKDYCSLFELIESGEN